MSLLRSFRTGASDAEIVVPAYWDSPPAPERPPVWKRLPVLILAAGTAYLGVGLALTVGPQLRGNDSGTTSVAAVAPETDPFSLSALQPAAETVVLPLPDSAPAVSLGREGTLAPDPIIAPPLQATALDPSVPEPAATVTTVPAPQDQAIASPVPAAVAPPEPASPPIASPEVAGTAPMRGATDDLALLPADLPEAPSPGNPVARSGAPAAPAPVSVEPMPVSILAAPPLMPTIAPPALASLATEVPRAGIRLGDAPAAPTAPVEVPRLATPAKAEPLSIDTRPAIPGLAFALAPAPVVAIAPAVSYPADLLQEAPPGAALAWEPLAEPEAVVPVEPPQAVAEVVPEAEPEAAAPAPAMGYRVVLHARGSLFDDARAAQSLLAQSGYETAFAPATGVRQNSVRYFYRDDAGAARAVARELGVGLVLLLDVPVATPPGTLEVWLSDPLGLPVDEARAAGVGADLPLDTALQ